MTKDPLDIDLANTSDENEDLARDSKHEETDETHLHISSPITSKDSFNDIEIHNCDGPLQQKDKEANDLTPLLPSSSENTSKRSSESIGT